MPKITYTMVYYPSISTNSKFARSASPEQKEFRNKKVQEIYGNIESKTLTHNCEGVIMELVDGEIKRRIAPKEFIVTHYNKRRVTENCFKNLLWDIRRGYISFDELYEDYGY